MPETEKMRLLWLLILAFSLSLCGCEGVLFLAFQDREDEDDGLVPAGAAVYVDGATGDDGDTGSTWDTAVATIQRGIDLAANGSTVFVQDGTYTGMGNKNLDFFGKAICLKSASGAENCIIDCQGAGRGFYFHSGETHAAVIDGFTIENGSTGSGHGGGIYVYNYSNPTIINCIIRNNITSAGGGGYGGGIYCEGSPRIINCLIADNTAEAGGGIGCFDVSPVVINCTIANNVSNGNGGGIFVNEADITLDNTIIWGNAAAWNGHQIFTEDVSAEIIMNYCDYSDGANDVAGVGTVTPAGCINVDPLFVDAPSQDYHLEATSPCVDAGDDSLLPPGITADLDGNTRFNSVTVDIGAYEHPAQTYTISSFDTSLSIDDNNERVIVDGGIAKLALWSDEFGLSLDNGWTVGTEYWEENGTVSEAGGLCTVTAVATGILRAKAIYSASVYEDVTVEAGFENFAWSLGDPSAWGCVILRLWVDINNFVHIYMYKSSSSQRIFAVKRVGGSYNTVSEIDSSATDFGFKITRSGDTTTFYYDDGGGWIQLGGSTSAAIGPNARVSVVSQMEDGSLGADVDYCRITATDDLYRDDSPECGVVDNAAVDWAFDAGPGKIWELLDADCVKSEPGSSSVLFKIGHSLTGNAGDVFWEDATWQTIAQASANAASGNYDGFRYIHVLAQFNSDGTVQPTLSSFSIKGLKTEP